MKLISPETLSKIEKRWPHLRPACGAAGITDEAQAHRAIASAALLCDVGYLSPVECLRLAEVLKNPAAIALGRLGGRSNSEAKKAAARENGRKGGRPKKSGHPIKLSGQS